MDAAEKKHALSLLGAGIGLQFVGWLVAAFFPIESIRRGAPLLISAGSIGIILSCVHIAKAKGYPWFVGLLGFFSCIGFAIVWFALPDKES
jgi:hypothetical protein